MFLQLHLMLAVEGSIWNPLSYISCTKSKALLQEVELDVNIQHAH